MFKNILKFLSDKKRVDNGPITHTIYDDKSPLKGSYNIKKEDIPKLYDLIFDIYKKNGFISIIERVGDICPLIIDLDFKYKDNITERQYTNETLDEISKYLNVKVKELFNFQSENQSQIWIMEKDTICDCDKKLYSKKDGIHILFPNLISNKKNYVSLINNIIKDKDIIEEIFNNTCKSPPSNPVNEIFDSHIYNPGNWFIYGSGKPGPNELTYKLTRVLKVSGDSTKNIPIDILLENPREIMNKNSVQINDKINVEFIGPEILKNKPTNNNVNMSINFDDIENIQNIVNIKKEDLKFINKLANILSEERASDCKNWIEVGYCLHSLSPKYLLNTWIKFSKKWENYAGDSECIKQWEYMNNTNKPQYTLGTLIYWAKKDNPDEFSIIQKESLKGLVDKSLVGEKTCGTHSDVANIVYNYYKDLFVCSGLKDNVWYYFDDNTGRWIDTEQGVILRKRLSSDIIDLYQHYSNFYKDKSKEEDPDSELYQIYDTRHSNCCKIMIKLKDYTYKDKIMKECKDKFYDHEFMDKLNSKKNLIGFDNGIIDLKYTSVNKSGVVHTETIFREGRPDDYVSLSVGYSLPIAKEDMPTNINQIKENIKSINNYHELQEGLDDFIKKVLPNDDVRDYTLRFLSSCLSGEVREEKFYFWTGSGSNGKSKITELIDHTLGEYSKPMDVSYLTTKRGSSSSASPELERIRYARFVSMSEPERDDQIYVGKLKQITGGDKMTSRGLFKDTTEFKPQFKIILMCNDLPKLAGNDGGVHRRIEVVDFISKFTDNPKPTLHNPHQYIADTQLGNKLKQWNTLFMIKLLDYYKMYDMEGTKAPASVTEATKVYITENDTIQKWIVEDLVESDDVTPLDDLMDCLKSWCEDQGFDFKKINKLEVKNALIKAQEKTSAGPAIFGKNIKENAPNGSSRCPKFNFITVEDEE